MTEGEGPFKEPAGAALAPPGSGEWSKQPRELRAAVQQAQAALDDVKRAFSIDET